MRMTSFSQGTLAHSIGPLRRRRGSLSRMTVWIAVFEQAWNELDCGMV